MFDKTQYRRNIQRATAATHAPSGLNIQPWHFIVICAQSVKNAISAAYTEVRTATDHVASPSQVSESRDPRYS